MNGDVFCFCFCFCPCSCSKSAIASTPASTPSTLLRLFRPACLLAHKQCSYVHNGSSSVSRFRTSRSRPSERGIAVDAAAALNWVSRRFSQDLKPVLWGQSLGAVVAPNAVASQIQSRPSRQLESAVTLREEAEGLKVDGLVLEDPFHVYPRYAYCYLPPAVAAIPLILPFFGGNIGQQTSLLRIAKSKAKTTVLILPPSNYELVPKPHGAELDEVCKGGGMDVRRVVVKASLHHEILSKPKGQQAVVGFLKNIAEKGRCQSSAELFTRASAMIRASIKAF